MRETDHSRPSGDSSASAPTAHPQADATAVSNVINFVFMTLTLFRIGY